MSDVTICARCGEPPGHPAHQPTSTRFAAGDEHAFEEEQMTLQETNQIQVAEALHLVSEPGNGTRYEAIGIRVRGPLYTGGPLGAITDGWLVTLSHNCRSYLFGHGDYVADWYVREKMGVSEADAPHVARLIAKLIGGTAE